MTSDSAERKEELKKFFSDPQIRETISRNLLSRKTMEKLSEYTAVPAEEKKPKTTRTRRKKKEEPK